MSLFDWFFPQQAQAAHLRSLSERTHRNQKSQQQNLGSLRHRIAQLEENQGVIALVLGSLLEKLDDNGVLARGDIEAKMQEIDEYDGIKDGKLNVAVLQQLASNADSDVAFDLEVDDESVHDEIASVKQQLAELEARFQ